MRIAYVVGTFPCRSETFIAREIAALEARGIQIEIFPLWGSRETAAAEAHAVQRVSRWGVREQLIYLRKHTEWQLRFLRGLFREGWGAWRALWHEGSALAMGHRMRQLGVAWVHAHFASTPSSAGWMAADVAGVPFSLSVHARDVFVEPQFLREKARAARAIVGCNSAVVDRVKELIDAEDAAKVALVHHGLPLADYPFREEPPGGPPLVLGVGRLVPKKGFVHLIRAVDVLRRRRGDLACWIIGDGPERAALEREIAALGLGTAVTLKDWMSAEELKAAYARASVLAVPSVVADDGDRDGLPNVVLEAAALGVPIVATDVGGLTDLVRDGETGLVTPPGQPQPLSARIREAVDDEELSRRLARAARREADTRFDADANADRLVGTLRWAD